MMVQTVTHHCTNEKGKPATSKGTREFGEDMAEALSWVLKDGPKAVVSKQPPQWGQDPYKGPIPKTAGTHY